MLKEIFELLRKIEAGIKHKSSIAIRLSKNGLVLQASISCTKNKQTYLFQRFFSMEEILDILTQDILVDSFINQANESFRAAYEESA